MIYLIVLFLLVILSVHYDIHGKTRGRNQWYYTMLVIFILISGLRWRIGADTTSYLDDFYHLIPSLNEINIEDFTLGNSPVWILLNSMVKTITGRFFVVQIIQALIVNSFIFIYFKKHCRYFFTCIAFYFIWLYFHYNTQELRASLAVVLCLFGNDYILAKKWFKGYGLYLIACLCHHSAILILIMPLFFFLKLDKKGLIAIASAFVVGNMIQSLFGEYIMLLEFDDILYDKAAHWLPGVTENNGTLMYHLIYTFPYVIFAIITFKYIKRRERTHDSLIFEPFLIINIVFYILSIYVRFFYRYCHFYDIYFILFYSICFVDRIRFSKKTTVQFSSCVSLLLFTPLFFAMFFYYYDANNYKMYLPYNSVLNREINKDREKRYNGYNGGTMMRPEPNYNEY